jgi:nucleoside-diphosphate-sugar epimerase
VTKALVTGGLGFIGYHLSARLLAEGFEVHAVDNGERGVVDRAIEELAAGGRYRLILSDIAEERGLDALDDGYDLVFHLAAIVGVGNVVRQPYRVLRDNASLLARMLDWAGRQKRLGRLVFASTSEVYAGTLEAFGMKLPTPESTPLTVADLGRARTSYMLSKIYGEALCHQAGVPFTIVRPHNIYGPRMGMQHVIPELLGRAHDSPDGGKLVVFSPGHSRTFCYIDDAVELIVRLARSPAGMGGTFNVGSPDAETRIADLAALIVRTLGKHLEIEAGPDTVGSPARRLPDVSLAITATRFTPSVSLAEGLRRCYAWYYSNVFAGRVGAPPGGDRGEAARSSRGAA